MYLPRAYMNSEQNCVFIHLTTLMYLPRAYINSIRKYMFHMKHIIININFKILTLLLD